MMRFLLLLPILFAFVTCGPPDDPYLSTSSTRGGSGVSSYGGTGSGGTMTSYGGSLSTAGGAASGGRVYNFGSGGGASLGGSYFSGGRTGGFIFVVGTGGVAVPNNNPSCMNDVITNGYICNGMSCASCLDNNTSLEDKCRKMVDCLQASWPCNEACWLECLNKSGGSGVLNTCVKLLRTAACSVPGCGATPAGPATDASSPIPDSSSLSPDASSSGTDILRPELDVAAPPLDAGERMVDAPVLQIDAVSSAVDAG